MSFKVNPNQLRKAFLAHAAKCTESTPTMLLILFYAAECGLKAALLQQQQRSPRLNVGGAPVEILEAYKSHDLILLLKSLRVPAASVAAIAQFRLKESEQESYPTRDLHLAWRYGLNVLDIDQKNAEQMLHEICNWVRLRLHI